MATNCNDYLTGGLALICKKGVAGGVSDVYALETEKISSFDLDVDEIVTGVTYVSTATTGFFTFEKETALYKEDGKVSANGDFVEQTLQMQFVKAQASTRTQVLLLTKRPTTFIVKCNTGKYFLLGKDKGLNATDYTQAAGKASTDLNGYTINLFGRELDLAPEVDSTAFTAI